VPLTTLWLAAYNSNSSDIELLSLPDIRPVED
jgi:hypothetical protein